MERVNESSCIPKRYKVYYDRKEEVIMRKIILASASPRRKELLERAGVDFEVLPASGDENRISDNPGEAVKPVSYTHLDVYKRQPWQTTAGQQGLKL